jgi:hypothetical protein
MIDWNVVVGEEAAGVDSIISDNIAASPFGVTKGWVFVAVGGSGEVTHPYMRASEDGEGLGGNDYGIQVDGTEPRRRAITRT